MIIIPICEGENMIQAETLDFELLAEKLLIDAYALRDRASWNALVSLLESAAQIGNFLKERDEVFAAADAHLV